MDTGRSRAALAAFVLGFMALMCWRPAFTIYDEALLMETVQRGLTFSPLTDYFASICRFNPLMGLEFNLLSKVSTSLTWYYAFSALQFAAFAACFFALLARSGAGPAQAALIVAAFSLSPGSVYAWFHLIPPDRFLLVFLALALLLLPRQGRGGFRNAALGVAALNLALYQNKETVFLATGLYALVELLASREDPDALPRGAALAVLASSALYLAVYLLAWYSPECSAYGMSDKASLLARLAPLAVFVFNDPAIMLLALPLGLHRAARVLLGRQRLAARHDAMLLAVIPYVLAFLGMGMSTRYYLLPAYVFALPALMALKPWRTSRTWALLGWAVLLLTAVNVLPSGLAALSDVKHQQVNIPAAMEALTRDMAASGTGGQRQIALSGLGVTRTLRAYLEQFGAAPGLWELTHLRDGKLPKEYFAGTPGHNDYLVILPRSYVWADPALLKALRGAYRVVFFSDDRTAVGDFSLLNLLKMALERFVFAPGAPPEALVPLSAEGGSNILVLARKPAP